MRVFDLRYSNCVYASDPMQHAYDMQAGMAMAAGYFGGYTSKHMCHVMPMR